MGHKPFYKMKRKSIDSQISRHFKSFSKPQTFHKFSVPQASDFFPSPKQKHKTKTQNGQCFSQVGPCRLDLRVVDLKVTVNGATAVDGQQHLGSQQLVRRVHGQVQREEAGVGNGKRVG